MAGITAIKRKGFRGGGMDAGNQSNQDQSASMGNSSNTGNTGNTGDTGNDGQSIQDYYDDYSKLTDKRVITNKDRDRVFAARPELKKAADEAVQKKADEAEAARKEEKRIQDILDAHRGKEPKAYSYGPPIVNPYGIKFGPKTKKETRASKIRKLALKNLIDKKRGTKSNLPNIFEMGNLFNPTMQDQDYTYNSPITTDMGVNLDGTVNYDDIMGYNDLTNYGLTGKNLTDIDRMNRAIDQGRSLGNITQTEFTDAFYGDKIPPNLMGGGGGDGQNQLPYIPGPGDTGDEGGREEKKFDYRFGTGQKEGLDVTLGRYFNQGGRVPRNMGGIMDAVPRQGYFLGGIGKAIGKIGKAAGKVLKSDIGKMAIAGAAFYYGGGGSSIFSKGAAGSGGFTGGLKALGSNFMSTKNPLLFNEAGKLSLGKLFGVSTVLPYLFGEAKPNEDIGMTDRGGRLIDPITGKEGTPQSMRDNIELAKLEADGDPDKLAALNQKYNNMLFTIKPYENYGVYTAANGGRIGRAEGGLMNLGGMEKDYRAEGGFVPIGREEKADDVPARLSVNEFVFTADAVRNAGGGDIDRGAEVMENMMKNLENGGRVSEESQGNTGAQEMFSVSERIGEVI